MKKPSMTKSILSFLSKVLVVAIIMIVIGVGSYQGVTFYLTGKFADMKNDVAEQNGSQKKESKHKEEEVKNEDVENSILFVDSEDGMYHYMILSLLNVNTNAMDLVLIPENSQVQISKKMQKKLSKKMDGISGTVEFRDIERIFGDDSYQLLAEIMEDILGLQIDGWDHMTAAQAVQFLNTVKTVDMNMSDSFSYRDVNGKLCMIESGEQKLDGEQALAYMTVLDGTSAQESNRLERCYEYLEKFMGRLISKKKADNVIENYQKCCESSKKRSFDALGNALKENKNSDFITFRILQGSEKGKVFLIDNQKAQLQLSTLMKQAASYNASNKLGKDSDDSSSGYVFDEDAGDSKDLSIEIYNAALIQGIAGAWRDYLESEGYNITIVDNYQDEGALSTTRIIVNKEGIAGDLREYFPNAEFSVGHIDSGGDIQIYVGTDSTDVGKPGY